VAAIARGATDKLVLGDLGIRRDWGWSPEYVDAMWRMLQQDSPQDFVIATGVSSSLQEFVQTAFEQVGLDWQDHVIQDRKLFRPTEIRHSCGDASKALQHLGWKASMSMREVARAMVMHELDPTQPI
jgi:GDPmannose 4,6-dehydratase